MQQSPQPVPAGYKFLRAVLIVGAAGFAVIGVFYLANGQMVPGLFALFLAVAEALALPLFKKLLESSRRNPADRGPDTPPSQSDTT
jgi:hypothetical protein